MDDLFFKRMCFQVAVGVLSGLALTTTTLAQAATTSPGAQPVVPKMVPPQDPVLGLSTAEQNFRQEQSSLGEQLSALIKSGASPEQLQAWRQQMASRLASHAQAALALTSAKASPPYVTDVTISESVPPDLANFIQNRADLTNAAIQLHRQLLASPNSAALGNEMTIFTQQNAAALNTQAQVAAALAATSASQPMPVPETPNIPANASPRLHAFLTLRFQLMKERAQLWNQSSSTDNSTRIALMQQWEQTNAVRLSQLQQQSQNLTSPSN